MWTSRPKVGSSGSSRKSGRTPRRPREAESLTTCSQLGRSVTVTSAWCYILNPMLPAIYAHRLGGAYGPDSSQAALARTLERQVDGLETDCCLTAGADIVLLHDPLLHLGTDVSGWAHERSTAEIVGGHLRDHPGRPTAER